MTAKPGRKFGITGKLLVQPGSTTAVDGQAVRLSGSYARRGKLNPGAIGLTLIMGLPGPLLYQGKSAHIEAGTELKVFTLSEKRVRVKD